MLDFEASNGNFECYIVLTDILRFKFKESRDNCENSRVNQLSH